MKAMRKAERTAPVTTSSRLLLDPPQLLGLVGVVGPGDGLVERALQLAAGVVGVESAEQLRARSSILSLRGELRVQQHGGALLLGGVDGRVEVGGDDRGEQRQRHRDPGVADREQPRDVPAGALRHQPAGQRRQRQAHPRAGEHLRDHRPQAEAAGQQRQAADAARHQQAARDRPGLRVARTREASRAATGSTLTARAAASGSMLQPETSSRTTRKMTAVSAAESSARAIAGRRHGPRRSGRARSASRHARGAAPPAGRPAAPGSTIGTWARKIARQSKASVRAPPSAGPTATPKTDAATQSRRPGPGRPPSSSSKVATSAAAPPSGLHAAEDEQQPQRIRERRSPARRARTGRCPPRPRAASPIPAASAEARQQRQREHRGVDAEHQGDALDGRVQLDQDRGQPQGDDRGVGQREAGRQREGCAAHGATLASRTHEIGRTPRSRRPRAGGAAVGSGLRGR